MIKRTLASTDGSDMLLFSVNRLKSGKLAEGCDIDLLTDDDVEKNS
jgi:hypothetical protein